MVFTPYGTKAAEYLAEGLCTDALHQAGIATGEVLIDVGGAEQGRGLSLAGQAVMAEEEFLHGAVTAVVAVAALDVFHLFGGKPVALALGEQLHALGIELGIVDGGVHINHLVDVDAANSACSAIDMLQKKVFVIVIVFVGNSVSFGEDNICRKRNQ